MVQVFVGDNSCALLARGLLILGAPRGLGVAVFLHITPKDFPREIPNVLSHGLFVLYDLAENSLMYFAKYLSPFLLTLPSKYDIIRTLDKSSSKNTLNYQLSNLLFLSFNKLNLAEYS